MPVISVRKNCGDVETDINALSSMEIKKAVKEKKMFSEFVMGDDLLASIDLYSSVPLVITLVSSIMYCAQHALRWQRKDILTRLLIDQQLSLREGFAFAA